MIERPILFSDPMVRAILDGTKTQTRRIMKPQPPEWVKEMGFTAFTPKGFISGRGSYEDQGPAEKFFCCPFLMNAENSDEFNSRRQERIRLWVRETWAIPGAVARSDDPIREGDTVKYKACEPDPSLYSWRVPIFMPRWASRINLEVTQVRAERLQEITEKDAQSEGAPLADADAVYPGIGAAQLQTHRAGFAKLWDEINGNRLSWGDNPWVWVVTFRRLT